MQQTDCLCRVCMGKGMWNIFSTNAINDEICTAASINNIRDKLQYVTELQLLEDDGLPLHICELCIIQLNVAFRFKQLAIESDYKLRQSHEAREHTPALTNYENVPEGLIEPERLMIKSDETLDEISVEPLMITEEQFGSYPPPNDTIVSNVCVKPDNVPAKGMVYLNKDIINPTEDEVYLKEIMKKEVITMPWPIINKETTDGQDSSPLTTIPTEQSEKRQKPAKSSQKRKRSKTRHDGSENDSQNSEKEPQTQAHSLTVSTSASQQTQNSTNGSTGSKKQRTKPTQAALRERRLQKVLNSLRIDMMFNTMERHSLNELQSVPNGETPQPKMIMKRRNSVCVSSFKPWM